jgi:hypothetical protein
MGRLRSKAFWLAVAILALWSFGGCGGGSKPNTPIFPGLVHLTPATNTSLALGGTLVFAASAQTTSGTNINTTFTFSSSDTSVLTIAPNGVACAGHWDVAFTTCTPGGTGAVQVTASALGESSVPTWVFVHPAIDSISVVGVLSDGVNVQEPCLSQSQSMTVEAHAFSQGVDITSSVGPFTWSANNSSVVTLIPTVNSNYNFATNQAIAKATFPGITQIYASASGVTSSSFQQPQFQNSQGTTSPLLDFFETCPIQNIALQVGAETVQTGQSSFVTTKGTSETLTAFLTDVMGNSSLPNTNGGIVLNKIPLTWTSSAPAVLGTTTSCLETCAVSTPLPGSASVTASCSPPTCNIGFPTVPASIASAIASDSCTQFDNFFHAQNPNFISCQQLIPVPVYASPVLIIPNGNNNTVEIPLTGNGALSGVVTGATSGTALVATSTGCAHEIPSRCTTSVYSFSSATAVTGPENPMPASPNSLLFDLTGDKAFMGSDYGAQVINPTNFGGTTSAFTSLGTVTGKVLAVSSNGSTAVFSDTVHTPNQVFIVNSNTAALTATALNISGAVTAGFSPDSLKTFIIGGSAASSLYVYSSLQAMQGPIPLTGPGQSIAFSPNGAFAFIAGSSTSTTAANLTAVSTCNNQVTTSLPLGAINTPATNPLFMRVLPVDHINGTDSLGNLIPDGIHIFILDSTGFDVITYSITPAVSGTLCPQGLALANPLLPVQRIELGQGTIKPVNFFTSADAAQLYVASSSNASILVYDFGTRGVTGIELVGNATPLSADMSPDAGTIVVGGSDGLLHSVNTSLGGSDQFQLSFPNVPNALNPFCTITPAAGPCTLNLIAVRP